MSDLFLTYSGYFLALLSVAANLWQARVRRRASRRKEVRDRRFTVYSEYLSKIDAVNSQLYAAQFGDEMQSEMLDFMGEISRMQSTSDVPPERRQEIRSRFAEIMQKNFELLAMWMEEQNKLLDEINKVRLVAISEVKSLLDEYSDAVQTVMESTVGLPLEFVAKGPGQLDLETLLNYGKLMERLKEIKRRLHTGMRKDIGVA